MGSRSRRVVWMVAFAVLLIGSTLAIGVWVSADSSNPDFPASVEDRYDELDGFSAERETIITRDNQTSRSRDRVFRRPGTGQYRLEDITDDPMEREIRISNGSTLWLYWPGEDEAKRIDDVDTTWSLPSRLDRMFAIIDRGSTGDADETHDIDPLPFVPDSSDRTAGIAGPMTVQYEGTDTVDERPTHVVRLESNATTTGVVEDFQQTLWIDREWSVPLKRTTEYVRDGDPVSITAIYRNVTFNPGLAGETFQFDPPASVSVAEADSTRQETFVDVASLRAVAEFSVPDPDVPETLRLVDATRTVSDHVRSIGLTYANETTVLTISKSNLTWYEPRTEGEAVTVGDHDATLRNLGSELRVSWTTADARYSVAGSAIAKSTLLAVADSVARADS